MNVIITLEAKITVLGDEFLKWPYIARWVSAYSKGAPISNNMITFIIKGRLTTSVQGLITLITHTRKLKHMDRRTDRQTDATNSIISLLRYSYAVVKCGLHWNKGHVWGGKNGRSRCHITLLTGKSFWNMYVEILPQSKSLECMVPTGSWGPYLSNGTFITRLRGD